MPGGQIFMAYGLLRQLTTEGAVAGVLAHEVGMLWVESVIEKPESLALEGPRAV